MKFILRLFNRWFASPIVRAVFDSIMDDTNDWYLSSGECMIPGIVHKSERFMVALFSEKNIELVNLSSGHSACQLNGYERFVFAYVYKSFVNRKTKQFLTLCCSNSQSKGAFS